MFLVFFQISGKNFFNTSDQQQEISFFESVVKSENFFERVGGFSKTLRNYQSGSLQILTSAYKVGGWGEKRPKKCLRNI